MPPTAPPHTALITGASAGIGAAFAHALASQGWQLVLTARRVDRLEALAAELHARHGTRVTVLPADLAQPAAVAALATAIGQQGLDIDMLVNNAGYGLTGQFLSRSWPEHTDFLRVMLQAPTELAHRLLPGMRARGYGRVINVASLAGLLPGTRGHTLYAAVKAYLIAASQSLALENRDHGVHVCALCPGFTWSEFHDVNGTRPLVAKMPRWMWSRADTVAREGLAAVEAGRAVYVPGRVNRLIKALAECLPDRLVLRLAARQSRAYRHMDAD